MPSPDDPAFPETEQREDGFVRHLEGMNVREYFTAAALQGLCANAHLLSTTHPHDITDEIARRAVVVADAAIFMLNE